MPSSWEEIICSRPLKFLVGPELKPFTLHSGAVKGLSAKLDNHIFLMEMSDRGEEDDPPIGWPDVNVETFLRFAQFVYTGEYDVPVPLPSRDDDDDDYGNNTTAVAAAAAAATSEGDRHRDGTAQARTAFNRRIGPYHSLESWREVLRYNPHKRLVPSPEQRAQQPRQPPSASPPLPPQKTQYRLVSEFCALLPHAPPADDPYPDFDSATLLAHARLHALAAARCGDMPSLRGAALAGIHRLLRHGDFLYDRVADVAALIDFAFAPCRARDSGDYEEEEEQEEDDDDGGSLRDMVTLYGACVYGVFLLHPSFVAVCRAHGEFSAGILDWLGGERGDGGAEADAGGPGESQLEDVIEELAEEERDDWGTYEDWWDVCG